MVFLSSSHPHFLSISASTPVTCTRSRVGPASSSSTRTTARPSPQCLTTSTSPSLSSCRHKMFHQLSEVSNQLKTELIFIHWTKTNHLNCRNAKNVDFFLIKIVILDFKYQRFLFSDNAHKGSLYTLFLHSPLSAFCFVTNIVDIPIHLWDKCLAYVDRFMTEASRLITRCRGVGKKDNFIQAF